MRIPVFVDGLRVGFVCDEGALRRYADAPNAVLARGRKRDILRIDVVAQRDDHAKGHSVGPGSALPTYHEHLDTGEYGSGQMRMLKRVNESGELVRWCDKDTFRPRRFNPDRIPRSLVASLA